MENKKGRIEDDAKIREKLIAIIKKEGPKGLVKLGIKEDILQRAEERISNSVARKTLKEVVQEGTDILQRYKQKKKEFEEKAKNVGEAFRSGLEKLDPLIKKAIKEDIALVDDLYKSTQDKKIEPKMVIEKIRKVVKRFEALEGKNESLDNALDDIYSKFELDFLDDFLSDESTKYVELSEEEKKKYVIKIINETISRASNLHETGKKYLTTAIKAIREFQKGNLANGVCIVYCTHCKAYEVKCFPEELPRFIKEMFGDYHTWWAELDPGYSEVLYFSQQKGKLETDLEWLQHERYVCKIILSWYYSEYKRLTNDNQALLKLAGEIAKSQYIDEVPCPPRYTAGNLRAALAETEEIYIKLIDTYNLPVQH